ncbi:MAG: hypothetical protein IJ121_08475, partial [Eubacterium sp.]|nr:hypothetical protein [Eubacterium sp.]
ISRLKRYFSSVHVVRHFVTEPLVKTVLSHIKTAKNKVFSRFSAVFPGGGSLLGEARVGIEMFGGHPGSEEYST